MSFAPGDGHAHRCQCCGHVWPCAEPLPTCKVETAAKANHSGPFCTMCRHGIMFLRYANLRGKVAEHYLKTLCSYEKTAPRDLEL